MVSKPPANLGHSDGKLAECPGSPNCVSTQTADLTKRMDAIASPLPAETAISRLKEIVGKMRGATIRKVEPNYLHVEFVSPVLRFVDDVEFLANEENNLIHFRSASRIGFSDFGANRRRMESIKGQFH